MKIINGTDNGGKLEFIWVPRILTIMYIIVLVVISMNGQKIGGSFFEIIKEILFYSTKAVIVAFALGIFWNRPYKAGFLMFILTMGFTGYYKSYQDIFEFMILTVIPLILALIFFYTYIKKDREEYEAEKKSIEDKVKKYSDSKPYSKENIKLNAKQKAKLRAKEK